MGIGKISQQHRFARGHIFGDRQSPGFYAGRENQAMGLRVMREQVLPRQEAGETEGRDTSPLALDPARVAIFISGQSQSR